MKQSKLTKLFPLMISNLQWGFQYKKGADNWEPIKVPAEITAKAMTGNKAGIKSMASFLSDYAGVQIQCWMKGMGDCKKKELVVLSDLLHKALIDLHSEIGFKGNLTVNTRTKKMRGNNTQAGFTLNADESTSIVGGGILNRFLGEIIS